jgi:hypothetical protein
VSPRAESIGAALIVVASFVLFSLYSLATPLFEASDELWHYPMVQHLATGGALPVQRANQTDVDAPWRQEGSQPPLYYWMAAVASASFDSSKWRELRRINPHNDMGVPTRDGNANAVLHTPAERLPWTPVALAVRAARLVSILMSTATVFFSYRVARELFPSSTLDTLAFVRLATPVLVATVPMFAFISGAINNDNAAVMFSTIGVWWALRLLRLGDLSARSAMLAGAIAGLGALSKSSALGLIGLFGLAAVLSLWSDPPPKGQQATPTASANGRDFGGVSVRGAGHGRAFALALLRFYLLLVLVTLAISGWWFARNQQLYGDPLGWNAFLDVVGRRDMPASLAQLWSEREGFVWAYWGVFGTLNVIMPPVVYTALDALVVIAAFGLCLGLVDGFRHWRREQSEAFGIPPPPALHSLALRQALLCAVWAALVFVAFLRWTSLTTASQGRLLFPCISVIAAAMAYGLWRIHRFALLAACAGMVALAIVVPFATIIPAYAQPSEAWAERLPLPIDATFGNAIRLVEGGVRPPDLTSVRPGDEVTFDLNWQLTRPVTRNFSVFVHLIDENDVIIAQRDMYPGQGNLALSEQPVGRRWSDHFTLRIPPLAPAPRQLRWAVGIYDHANGERLRLADGNDRAIFGGLELVGRASDSPVLHYINGLELSGYRLDPAMVGPGDVLTATTHWRTVRPIDRELTLSLQLLDDHDNKIAQQDLRQPLTEWVAGQTIDVTHALQVGAEAPSGVYRLLMVWYTPDDLSRLPAYDARGRFAGDQIELARVRVR